MELRQREERRSALEEELRRREEEVEQLKNEKVLLEQKVQQLTGRSWQTLHSEKCVESSEQTAQGQCPHTFGQV